MTRPTIDATNTLTSYSELLYGIDENFDEETFLDAITSPAMANGGTAGTEYYTIDGIRLNQPKRGINIVRTTGSDGKVSVKRILVN